MIAEKVMYHVICDGCGTDAQKGSAYVAWADRDTARIEPEASGWWTDGEQDLCTNCYENVPAFIDVPEFIDVTE